MSLKDKIHTRVPTGSNSSNQQRNSYSQLAARANKNSITTKTQQQPQTSRDFGLAPQFLFQDQHMFNGSHDFQTFRQQSGHNFGVYQGQNNGTNSSFGLCTGQQQMNYVPISGQLVCGNEHEIVDSPDFVNSTFKSQPRAPSSHNIQLVEAFPISDTFSPNKKFLPPSLVVKFRVLSFIYLIMAMISFGPNSKSQSTFKQLPQDHGIEQPIQILHHETQLVKHFPFANSGCGDTTLKVDGSRYTSILADSGLLCRQSSGTKIGGKQQNMTTTMYDELSENLSSDEADETTLQNQTTAPCSQRLAPNLNQTQLITSRKAANPIAESSGIKLLRSSSTVSSRDKSQTNYQDSSSYQSTYAMSQSQYIIGLRHAQPSQTQIDLSNAYPVAGSSRNLYLANHIKRVGTAVSNLTLQIPSKLQTEQSASSTKNSSLPRIKQRNGKDDAVADLASKFPRQLVPSCSLGDITKARSAQKQLSVAVNNALNNSLSAGTIRKALNQTQKVDISELDSKGSTVKQQQRFLRVDDDCSKSINTFYFKHDGGVFSLTEKLINKILDKDYDSQGLQSHQQRQANNIKAYSSSKLNTQHSVGKSSRRLTTDDDCSKSRLSQEMPRSTTRYLKLYNDGETLRQKLANDKLQLESERRMQEFQECTFSPKIYHHPQQKAHKKEAYLSDANKENMGGDNGVYKKRSPRQFYEDMIRFKEAKAKKISNLKQQEEIQMIENQVGQNRKLEKSKSKEVIERLTSEALKKTKKRAESKSEERMTTARRDSRSPLGGTQRTNEEVVKHLYTDYFTREKKLQSLQQFVQKQEQQSSRKAIDLKRANQVMGNKVAQQVRQTCSDMKLQNQLVEYHGYVLNFFQMVDLMARIGYTCQEPLDDENFNSLQLVLYRQIYNLFMLIFYFENSNLQMICVQTYLDNQQTLQYSLLNYAWQILSLSPDDYHEAGLTERNLVVFLQAVENIYLENMICSYPMLNKDLRPHGFIVNEYFYVENEQEVLKLHQTFIAFYQYKQSLTARSNSASKYSNSVGYISQRSQRGNRLEIRQLFHPQINEKSKQLATQQIAQLENALNTQPSSRQKSVRIKIEDLLISRGQVIKEKLKLKRLEREAQIQHQIESEKNTFSPRLQTEKISKKLLAGQQQSRNRNVFDSLYRKAQTQKLNRTREESEFERNKGECTFKPNLNQTKKVNEKVSKKAKPTILQQIPLQEPFRGSFQLDLTKVESQVQNQDLTQVVRGSIENIIFGVQQPPRQIPIGQSSSSISLNPKTLENFHQEFLDSSSTRYQDNSQRQQQDVRQMYFSEEQALNQPSMRVTACFNENQPNNFDFTPSSGLKRDSPISHQVIEPYKRNASAKEISAKFARQYLTNAIKSNL